MYGVRKDIGKTNQKKSLLLKQWPEKKGVNKKHKN